MPKRKKNVRAFLGLAGYYQRFIPEFLSITSILSDLTRKDSPDKVKWMEETNRAFKRIKKVLTADPILQSPREDLPFVLQTDASGLGIGAILSQQDLPIVYY